MFEKFDISAAIGNFSQRLVVVQFGKELSGVACLSIQVARFAIRHDIRLA